MNEHDEVIITKLEGLEKLFNEKFTTNAKEHEAIIKQTTKTNGTTGDNSRRLTKLEKAKAKVVGALILANVLIVPIGIAIIINWIIS